MKPSQCEACRAVGPTVMCNLCPTGPRRSVQPPATPQEPEQAQTLNDVFDVFETWARRKGATDTSSVSLGFWAFNEFHAIIGQPLRDWLRSRRASTPSPVEPTPEPETCASECNPYMSRCGAKFCTFEDMAAHEQECKRLVPSEETK